MGDIRVIFMGTPVFATGILQTLIDHHYNVVAVVSQPDKNVGRHQVLTMSPVKELAQKYNIPVIQPLSIKNDYQAIEEMKPDLIVTCAYGQFVPEAVLKLPKYGCINVHASLLPKYRGGAPIHTAIMKGETQTGITIMEMIKKMDAGKMYAKATVTIEPDDTTAILHDKLMKAGADLLIDMLPEYLAGHNAGEEQDEALATVAPNISKEQEFVSFADEDVDTLYNHIRGLITWPLAYGVIDGKRIKFHEVRKSDKVVSSQPGEIVGIEDDALIVACKNGSLLVKQLQLEGKSKMDAHQFFNGVGRQLLHHHFE